MYEAVNMFISAVTFDIFTRGSVDTERLLESASPAVSGLHFFCRDTGAAAQPVITQLVLLILKTCVHA